MQSRNRTDDPRTKFILHNVVHGTKTNFEGNNGYFVYFYNFSNQEITQVIPNEQNVSYIALSKLRKQSFKKIMAISNIFTTLEIKK